MRILYLMHVPWGWVKQRPHQLADALAAAGDDVEVYAPPGWRKRQLVKHSTFVNPHVLWHIPPANEPIRTMNSAASRLQIVIRTRRRKFDLVWVTHPKLLSWVPKSFDGRLVYDCMDRNGSFPGEPETEIRALEDALVARAELILCSSGAIAEDMRASGVASSRLVVVNNALDAATLPPARPSTNARGATTRAAYVGTISSWFDWTSLLHALEVDKNLHVTLVGPSDSVIPSHPRIIHLGPRPHADALDIAAEQDVLLMPFQRTHLVEGVDPVKLYEYIALRRPIVTVWYPELERFRRFVRFYSTPHEFAQQIGEAARGHGVDESAVDSFVAENTWQERAGRIRSALGREPS